MGQRQTLETTTTHYLPVNFKVKKTTDWCKWYIKEDQNKDVFDIFIE